MAEAGKPEVLADGSPRVQLMLLRREQWRLLHNWDSLGLRGTGSVKSLAERATAQDALARCLRDVHAATQDLMVAEPSFELCGRLLLGLPASTNQL